MATSGNFNTALYFPVFVISDVDLINSIGIRWKKYLSRFKTFLVAMDINSEDRQRALLLHFGGSELQDIHDSLDDSGDTYDELRCE